MMRCAPSLRVVRSASCLSVIYVAIHSLSTVVNYCDDDDTLYKNPPERRDVNYFIVFIHHMHNTQ
jgi:hypothetical protein